MNNNGGVWNQFEPDIAIARLFYGIPRTERYVCKFRATTAKMFVSNDAGEQVMLIDLRFIIFENTICAEGLDRSVQRLAIKFREQKVQFKHTFRTISLINPQKYTQTVSV